MAGRPGSSFAKLQKERARKEKALEKQARRQQRKLDKQSPGASLDDAEQNSEDQLPHDGPVIDFSQ